MSYSIMYDSIFIKSAEGITPAVLMGDGNVYEPATLRHRERRAREWSSFNATVGASAKDLMSMVQSWAGGPYQEHWKKNGKWVDDAAMLRWMANGIKNAVPLEDVLRVNDKSAVKCCTSVWIENKNSIENSTYVKTTEEFDAWVQSVKVLKASLPEGGSGYPIIDFAREKLVHPQVESSTVPERVVFYSSRMYLTAFEKNERGGVSSTSWSKNIKDAMILGYDEAKGLQVIDNTWLAKAKMVDAKKAEKAAKAAMEKLAEGLKRCSD